MTFFKVADKISMNFEGGYVNDPDDPGLQTFSGISRRYHPEVDIWPIIDEVILKGEPVVMTAELEHIIKTWYKRYHWDFFGLDTLGSQRISNEIYDSGINLGRRTVGKFVQSCVNTHMSKGRILLIDGYTGPVTQAALAEVVAMGSARVDTLYKQLNSEQGHHYTEAANKNERVKKFIVGWFRRVYEDA